MSDHPHEAESFFAALAEINEAMIGLSHDLAMNTHVIRTSCGCDIRKFSDFMRPEDVALSFNSYFEIDTIAGETYSWLLDIRKTEKGWHLDRHVDHQTRVGGKMVIDFDDAMFSVFGQMVEALPHLLDEFVQSAKTFDFIDGSAA